MYKQLCQTYHLSPSKQYGQHFLISEAPIRKMIAAAELTPTDTVIEIGPGFGVLTLAVAPLVKKVLAFEIEKKLQPYWEEKIKEYPNIEIVWGDFLRNWKLETRNLKLGTSDRRSLISSFQFPISYKVLANLPYQITSRVLRLFLEMEHKPERLVLMVQKEVAERICARPGDMSLLAVAVQYYGAPKIVAQVPRGNFWPEPKVDSAVIVIKTQKQKNTENTKTGLTDEMFFRLVKAGFAQPRQQLWRNLARGLKLDPARVKSALRAVVGNEKARAQELTVAEWRELTEVIHASIYVPLGTFLL